MDFVELNRSFVPIPKDQEPNIELGRFWGRRIGGWKSWDELLEYRRIMLLAEAESGKTEELRNQARKLTAAGKLAFFVRIEELADQGFETALEPDAMKKFEEWQKGSSDGWFFLDSVDEARLNHKSLETALKRFARALDPSLERARVIISCRVTDWRGDQDRATVAQHIPARKPPKPAPVAQNAEVNPLLDPIFDKKTSAPRQEKKEEPPEPYELQVFQLAPLLEEQYRTLALASGVKQVDDFITGINKGGLDAFTERPGDVLDLAQYWNEFGKFDALAVMTDHAIVMKLRETDPHRPDNAALSADKAREGAERLAGALTLGKTFTLRVPGHDPDPSLVSGAMDPLAILPDWSDAQRSTLARRAIFAPSTYGRIRFHHRTTQEYLCARWLHNLLAGTCPREEIWNLIFAERYGVETVVPSLRPVAAWLALWHPDLCDEIVRREPLVLLQYGDPGSLPLSIRERLLANFASKQNAAEIADDHIDHRSLWMFADARLADAIRAAWLVNSRDEFRITLLRLIREGAISACLDLAREIALSESASDYSRIAAVQAIQACDGGKGLGAIARAIKPVLASLSPRVAASFSEVLYPRFLTVSELLNVISTCSEAAEKADGFSYRLTGFYENTADELSRLELIGGLAELCLAPPFVSGHKRISARYYEVSKDLESLARMEAQRANPDPPPELVRLLMAVERADRHPGLETQKSLAAYVQENTKLNRALFWSDVDERRRSREDRDITRHWQIYIDGHCYWALGSGDLDWLEVDMQTKPRVEDRQIALSAIVPLLHQAGRLQAEKERLRALVRADEVLAAELEQYLAPPKPDADTRKHERWMREHERKYREQEDRDKASWEKFRDELMADPGQLRDPEKLRTWKTGAHRLYDLTRWLHLRVGNERMRAVREWRLLEEGFGRDVAWAYRDGMKTLWRLTKPERPIHKNGNQISTKWATILAYAAVGLEAAEDPDWATKLPETDIVTATKHGCYAEQGYPDWLDSIAASYPAIVLPIIKETVGYEWKTSFEARNDFFYRYREARTPLPAAIQAILFDAISGAEPKLLSKLDHCLRLIGKLDLEEGQEQKLVRIAHRRLRKHGNDQEWSLRYIGVLLMLDGDRAIDEMRSWLGPHSAEAGRKAVFMLGKLFDRHDALVTGLWDTLSVAALENLLALAYAYVRPEDDLHHEGSYSPNLRDHAQRARDTILGALLNRPGADAYRAYIRLLALPEFTDRYRYKELARGKAERDTERSPWLPADILSFLRTHAAPVRNGHDLARVVAAVLTDINRSLRKGDVTSRPLLERAKDEDEVQNWLVEQMNFRAKEQFRVFREAEVAQGDKPDLIVSSTTAACEVAIEVKHGGMEWTPRKFAQSLRKQLAEDYLKPEARRNGMLVITHHGKRTWRDPDTNAPIDFDTLIQWLRDIATTLTQNSSGAIEVHCFGIDASPPPAEAH